MCVPVVPCRMLGMLGRSLPLPSPSFPIRKMGLDVLFLKAPMTTPTPVAHREEGLGRWPQQRARLPSQVAETMKSSSSHSSNQRGN